MKLLVVLLLAFTLRLFQIDKVPPALYWDEASLGYNAYTISQTLRDEHGRFLPWDYFTAFGDYKPPGYIYAAAASIKLFGLTEAAVRLPSVLAGVLLVFLTYFLAKELTGKKETALFAAIFTAVSPWAIQMSRGAFEANLATLFSTAGILLFLFSVRKNVTFYALLSGLAFALSVYTFNSHRVFVPLLLVALALIYRRLKPIMVLGLVLVILVIPTFPHLTSPEGRLRFNEVTWLNDLDPVTDANSKIASDGGGVIAKLIHNRRLVWASQFTKHYLDHFKPDFLFLTGDMNGRLSSQAVGTFYLLDALLLVIGIVVLVKSKSSAPWLLLAWVGLGLVPAAMARETPHALRILNILPAPHIIMGLGAAALWQRKKLLTLMFGSIYTLGIVLYLHNLFSHYPFIYSQDWQYGYKELVAYVSKVENKYDAISITPQYGRPYIYFLFYQKYPLDEYLKNRVAVRDDFGFWTIKSFSKYHFSESSNPESRWLYVREAGRLPVPEKKLLTITDLSGKAVFDIGEN